jgi:hypothetical protein
MDIPHKERTFDAERPRTTLAELLERHAGTRQPHAGHADPNGHHCVWVTEDLNALCAHFNWTIAASQDPDDKTGLGFTVVIQKAKEGEEGKKEEGGGEKKVEK